jgi:DNA-binding transcriptional LysR family regulator
MQYAAPRSPGTGPVSLLRGWPAAAPRSPGTGPVNVARGWPAAAVGYPACAQVAVVPRLWGHWPGAAAGGHRGEGPAVAGPRRARHGFVQAAQVGLAQFDAGRGGVLLDAVEAAGAGNRNDIGSLAQFRRRYPGVSLALHSGLIAKLLGLLDAGDVDLVVGPVHDDLPATFHARPLVAENLVLVTAPGHPLAAQRRPVLAAARDEPFVCLAADSRLHAILTGAAAADGFVPRIEFETYGPASIRELVAAGLGVALLARSAAEGPGPAVGMCELARPPEHPPIGLIRSRARPLPPAARAFWDHLAAIAGGVGGGLRRAAGG